MQTQCVLLEMCSQWNSTLAVIVGCFGTSTWLPLGWDTLHHEAAVTPPISQSTRGAP